MGQYESYRKGYFNGDRLRVLICGDREWENIRLILDHLKLLHLQCGFDVLIEGEARGADTIARNCGKYIGMTVLRYPANWKKYKLAAGPIRNQQMLDEGKPDLVVAFHNNITESKGTKDMIERTKKAGIPYYIIKEETND